MNIRNFSSKIIGTFFYVGFLPFVPGTFGSAAGLGIFFLVKNNTVLYLCVALAVSAVGFLCAGRAERALGRKDPPYIVIDEVAGMLLSLLFVPDSLRLAIIAFVLFRLLDTLKPYPAARLQDLHGSAGIMLDDIVAAAYTNLILQVVSRGFLKL